MNVAQFTLEFDYSAVDISEFAFQFDYSLVGGFELVAGVLDIGFDIRKAGDLFMRADQLGLKLSRSLMSVVELPFELTHATVDVADFTLEIGDSAIGGVEVAESCLSALELAFQFSDAAPRHVEFDAELASRRVGGA